MNRPSLVSHGRSWIADYITAWDQFWFTPRLPYTLGVLRIITGTFLLYSHLVLATDLDSFLGVDAWINNDTARSLHDGTFGTSDVARSYLWAISNPLLIWLHHGLTILVTLAFAVGFMTRITAPAAWFLQLMYLHRLTGALFGFDQIVTYSTMYLMISPCGSCFSVDAWLRERLANKRATSRGLTWLLPELVPSVSANIATRLLQLHLCVIYLFGGLAKSRGESWWDGTAMWYAIGNYEYQSIDMTWLSRFPTFYTALTHITLFWEIFYCAIVWPRRTRPIALGLAVAVHGGIALTLGMITFGLMMIAANLAFIEPETMRRWLRIGSKRDPSGTDPPEEVTERVEIEKSVAQPLTPAMQTAKEAELEKKEKQLRSVTKKLRERRKRLKERESKFKRRVEQLKEREEKVRQQVERRSADKGKPT